MLNIKTLNEVVINIINNIYDAIPEADTKEGTFLRDVIIDPVAHEFSDIYKTLYNRELSQSVLTATGKDLDNLASNYFIERKNGTKSTGKVRFYIKGTDKDISDLKFPDIRISKGTVVSTKGSLQQSSIQFKTLDEIYIPSNSGTSIINGQTTITTGVKALPKDSTGFRYVEIACESLDIGEKCNVGPYSVISQSSLASNYIYNVTNPFSFSGGTDAESDISLALRLSLAISGSNIGTKNGYMSYMLQQPQVLDACIVGAGDVFMERDILTIIDPETGQKVEQHMGGKVDIYTRTDSIMQDEFTHIVTIQDLNNDFKVPQHIIFPSEAYPVENVVSIMGKIKNVDGTITYKSYINAGDFELEKNTDKTIINYYIDIPWDFSIKNYFPDTEYYPFPINTSSNDIKRLKMKLDNELQLAAKYLQNVSYKINWDLVKCINNTNQNETILFDYGKYTDNLFYKLEMKPNTPDGAILGGRIFIKKQDQIYVRAYITPDFELIKDTSNFQGSVFAQDYIKWFNKPGNLSDIMKYKLPQEGEELCIKYIHNIGIKELQDGIESKRVLTADVLIKSAVQKNVEIKLNVICSSSYDPSDIKKNISDSLSYYVNSEKKLGSYLDQSDIIYIVKSIDGVISVDIDTVGLSFSGQIDSQIIECKPNEFFHLQNLIISVSNTFTV